MKEDNENALNKVLLDVQKEYAQSNKLRDKLISWNFRNVSIMNIKIK